MDKFRWEEIPHEEQKHIQQRNKEWYESQDKQDPINKLAIDIAYNRMAEYGIEPENLQKFMNDCRIISTAMED